MIKISSGTKLTKILHVCGPNFLGGAPPRNFWIGIIKIQPDSDHVAKFQGDRWRDLGELLAKKKKNTCGKTYARPGIDVPGGLIMFKTSKFIQEIL